MIKFKERGNVSFSNFRLKEHQCDYEPIIGLIMVKNQERRILQTLESIVNICDQIIMVDTGSSDNTVAIVESNYNSVLIKHVDWKEDYAAMRNKCLTFVPNDTWVLFVDSDEIFSKEYNSEEIKSFLYEVDKRFPNQDKICTVKQMQPDRPTYVRPERFVKKTETLYYFGYVHEEPRTKRTEKLVKIDTDLELMNNGLTKGEYAKFNKQQRYAMLLKKNIALEPDNPRWTSLISPEENLRLGNRSGITEKDIAKACQLALIDTDINKMAMQYQTKLDENGNTLSGGQRQRLTIARALLSPAQVLIFDESTSGLDAITEKQLIDNLVAMTDKTIIFIAHRLSIAKRTNHIIVLHDGRVAEEGTHAALLNEHGYYYDLINS